LLHHADLILKSLIRGSDSVTVNHSLLSFSSNWIVWKYFDIKNYIWNNFVLLANEIL